jgi:hypothetical protein
VQYFEEYDETHWVDPSYEYGEEEIFQTLPVENVGRDTGPDDPFPRASRPGHIPQIKNTVGIHQVKVTTTSKLTRKVLLGLLSLGHMERLLA